MLILTVLAASLALASPQDKVNPPRKEQVEESAKRIKELQKERIDTLKKVVDVSSKLAQAGRIEIGEALEARMSLLKAELEVAEKESDRIDLYRTALASLEEYLQLARARFQAGRVTELPLHTIKARYLEVKIALEQARVKEAKEGK